MVQHFAWESAQIIAVQQAPEDSIGTGASASRTAASEQSVLPPFVENEMFLQDASGSLDDERRRIAAEKMKVALKYAVELPQQNPFVLLKTLPTWSQALFDVLPLADAQQSQILFEVLVSCLHSIKNASDSNHDFIQSILSDWITWSVSNSPVNSDGLNPLYLVLLREFVRLLRPWLGLRASASHRSFPFSHTAALSVADVILSLISKLVASTGDSQPLCIEESWAHVCRLASSLGKLIASGDMRIIDKSRDEPKQSPQADVAKDLKDQPNKELPNYLNVCSALAEFLRGWFSLGQRGAATQACFAFCHALSRTENLIVYFWKRFCSEITDSPFIFPPGYPDVQFPLFHWTGPDSRSCQKESLVGTHISKAGVENTPIASVAFNLCTGMLLKGSPNGISLGLCVVNTIIRASCDFIDASTAAVIRSSAATLLEHLLLASAPFIALSISNGSDKGSRVYSKGDVNFFSLVARTLTCVSDADWEQYWLQEIDKNNIAPSGARIDDSRHKSAPKESSDPNQPPAPMSLYGWLRAMLTVACGEWILDEESQKSNAEVAAAADAVPHDGGRKDMHSANPSSRYLNYSSQLDDDVKFSLAVGISNGLHVLMKQLKTEKFLQRLDVSERKTHFFDLMICDDSAKITGISTGKSGPKLCTLFEATWSLLLHLHFVLLCNPVDYIAAKAFDASSSHMSMGPDGVLKDPKDDAPGERPSGPRRSITMNSVQAAANAKQMLEKQYGERGSRLSVTEKRSGRSSTVIGGRVDPAVTKNVLAAVHETLKLLLDQSMHCMFSPSIHDVLSCHYRNKVILQIFLEGARLNQSDPSNFTNDSAQASAGSIRQSSLLSASAPSDSAIVLKSDVPNLIPPSFEIEIVPTIGMLPSVSSDLTDVVASELLLSRGAPKSLDVARRTSSADSISLAGSTASFASDDVVQSAPSDMLLSRGARGPSDLLLSRGARNSITGDSVTASVSLGTSQASLGTSQASLGTSSERSWDAWRTQGNIKFLTEFMIMFIRENFSMNASNLFASRYCLHFHPLAITFTLSHFCSFTPQLRLHLCRS